MRFIIVTGMSGAGKSTALKFLEDIGFFCADNIPPALIADFAKIWDAADVTGEAQKAALGIDVRGGKMLNDLLPSLERLKNEQCSMKPEILFLEASDEVLIKRFKETRRTHPLKKNGRIEDSLYWERKTLEEIKQHSDFILDTSHLLARQLKEKINEIFLNCKNFDNMIITVMSFGFKHGIPGDADLVFDTRFLPNPYYEDNLKGLTGNDKAVRDFVMNENNREAFVFFAKLTDMMDFLIPRYIAEGKTRLVVSIGCTGGRHRSVTIANALYEHLSASGKHAVVNHRDIP